MCNDRVIAFSRLRAMMQSPPTESRLLRIAASASGNKNKGPKLPGLVLIAGGQTLVGGLRAKLKKKMVKFDTNCEAKLSETVKLHAAEYLERYPNGSAKVDESMIRRAALMTVSKHLIRCIHHLHAHALESEDLRFLKDFNSVLEQTTEMLSGDFYSLSMDDAYLKFVNLEQKLFRLLEESGLPGYALAFNKVIGAREKMCDGRDAPARKIGELVNAEWEKLRRGESS